MNFPPWKPVSEYANAFIGAEGIPDAPEGGYVYVNWEIPDDPQLTITVSTAVRYPL